VVAVPLALGAVSATLTVTTDNPGMTSFAIPLTASGIGSMVTVTPNFVDFGASLVNQDSPPQTIAIGNSGTDTLNVATMMLNGADASSFMLQNAPKPPFTVAAKTTQPVSIVFHPSAVMQADATLDMTTDDPMAKLVRIPLAGVGAMAGVSVDKLSVTFPPIDIGTVSAAMPVTVTNSGGTDVNITTVSLGGSSPASFSVDQTGPLPLAVGQSQTLSFTFSPLVPGNINATASLALDQGLAPITIKLAGTATAPLIGVRPGNLDFGPVAIGQMSDVQTVTLLNAGKMPIVIAAIASSDAEFTVDTSATMLNLGPMQQTTFAVQFTPSQPGARMANVAITLKGQSVPAAMVPAAGAGVTKRMTSGCGVAPSGSAWPLGLLVAAGLSGAALRRRRARG
jgi:MYXO-CTERM domain-containing protein